MYNPFSVLNTLLSQMFNNYWFETGTPSFLIRQLKNTNNPLELITREEVTADSLNSIEEMDENSLLYQSGYLTIKGYDQEFNTYLLVFLNREVEEGFVKYLVPFYCPSKAGQSLTYIGNFVREVRNGDAETFMRRVERFLDGGDY